MVWLLSNKSNGENEEAAHRRGGEEDDKTSKSFLSRFRRRKGSDANEEEAKEIRPDSKDEWEQSGLSPEAQSPQRSAGAMDRSSNFESSLPGSVLEDEERSRTVEYDASPAERSATNAGEVLAQRARQVKNAAKLVNSEWEDSDSEGEMHDQEVLERVMSLRKEEAKQVVETKSEPASLGIVRFERRKRQIAGRFQTRRELVAFEKEEGPNVGGQWIDQKWVPNKVLNIKRDEFTIQKWAKDLGTYLILLFAFTYLIFSGSGFSEFNAYQRVWRNMVRPRVQQITSPGSAIGAIEKLVLEDLVAGRRGYVPGYSPPGGPGSKVLLGSIMVGKIRLRQLRVKGTACSRVHKMLKDAGMVKNIECYPAYVKGTEEVRYSKENMARQEVYSDTEQHPYFTYRSPLETNYLPTSGVYGEYDSGGYIAVMDMLTANNTLADLRKYQWVDKKTRALFLDFSFYNDDMSLFVSSNVLVEFASGQTPVSKVVVSAIAPMDDTNDFTRLGMLILVFVMVIYYALEELDLCRATGIERYKSISWAYLDLVNIALFILAGLLKGYNLVAYAIAIPTGVTDEDMLTRIADLGRSKYLHDKIQGLNGFLLWFKVFKYVTITRPLMRMSRVLATCVPDILSYAFLFWVVLIAFAVLGYLFCGNELESFSSIESSILTIMRSMYGDFDFDGLVEVSGVTGFIYLGLWLVTSNIVLVNMFIAILSETYHRVTEEERANPTDTTYSKIIEQLDRRKRETEQLRTEAIALYGKKRYKEEQKQRKKNWVETVFVWLRTKFTGKKPDNESNDSDDDKSEEDIEDQEDRALGESPAKQKDGKQELASLEWEPWISRVDPVAKQAKKIKRAIAQQWPTRTANAEELLPDSQEADDHNI